MKKIISFILCLLLATFYFLPTAEAHVLKADGSIGAVLHIDPDDDPIVGKQAGFFFEFKDKQNKFTPQNCDCTFSVTEDGKQIFSQPLFQNNPSPSLENASVFFTFPEKNVYQVTVSGKPNTPDGFQPFTLNFDVRVARTADNNSNQNPSGNTNWVTTHIPLVVGLMILGLFFIIAFIKQFLKSGGDSK